MKSAPGSRARHTWERGSAHTLHSPRLSAPLAGPLHAWRLPAGGPCKRPLPGHPSVLRPLATPLRLLGQPVQGGRPFAATGRTGICLCT